MLERPGSPILSVRNLVHHFPIRHALLGSKTGAVIRAVDGVSFELRRGDTLAVVGESGSGKTTLGRLVLRLLEPTSGEIAFGDTDITRLPQHRLRPLRRRFQMIFQDTHSALDPRMRVRDILGEPLAVHGLAKGRRRERIAELLETVGLDPSYAGRHPHQFSGGQRQRIGIARALAVEPELIVGDEPVSALDVSVRAQILNLLAEVRASLGLSMMIITHDLGVVRHIANRVLVLYLGRIVEIGDVADIFGDSRHPYTRALIAATPDPFRAPGPRQVLEGEIPSPARPPSGCRFHTRCPIAESICSETEPVLEEQRPGHFAACHFARRLRPLDANADVAAGGRGAARLAVLTKAAAARATP